MSARAPLRRIRRFWPQKVRTRLTLLYATLFFAAGSALLGLTYGLVASSLPTTPAVASGKISQWSPRTGPPSQPAANRTAAWTSRS